MSSTYIKLPPSSGGGGGAVDSVNGQTGVVVLTKSDIGLGNVNNTSDANKPISTATQTALNAKLSSGGTLTAADGTDVAPGIRFTTDNDSGFYQTGDGNVSIAANGARKMSIDQTLVTVDVDLDVTGNISAANYPPVGSNNTVAGFDGSGALQSIPGWGVDTTTGGISFQLVEEPNGTASGYTVHNDLVDLEPLQNSPNESWNFHTNQMSIDPNNSGFTIGTSGNAVRMLVNNVVHNGSSDVGSLELIHNNFSFGNGTDPIDVKGVAYAMGFGQFAANVNVSGPIQGYGFQPALNAASTMSSTQFVQAFYDNGNFPVPTPNYTSFNASPSIDEVVNNNNYTGFNVYPTIGSFTGNAGANSISVSGNYGAFDTGGYNGLNVNPTITSVQYANGISVTMDNVTVYAGTVSSLVIQDLTISFQQPSDSNAYQVEYLNDGTAGSETAGLSGQLITVHMEAGVSTALQIKAAIEANFTLSGALTVVVSGTGSNTQTAQVATNFAGGTNPGSKKAAALDGDVEITGALSFGGALSIGKLNAFATQALFDTGGNPSSIHSLITQPTVGDNITLTTADSISVNTAALISIGNNSSVSTAFIGIAALGLPAVLTMGTGSTVDRIYGALFALSLDATATGGTVDEVGLCRSVAIPNGVTAVNNLYGYLFDLPFGDPGTKTFGFYDRPGKNNYFAGNLLIGGTPGSDDLVVNSSVALEINSTTKAFLNARMTTTERNALTAVNGLQIYNSTDDKLQVYAGGSWVDLH